MSNVQNALAVLTREFGGSHDSGVLSFPDFLDVATEKPELVFRNINQLFYDMIHHYVPPVENDEFFGKPGLTELVRYDYSDLFVNGCDEPFFADSVFVNNLIQMADSFKHGTQQNKIYVVEGPPGSGKSIFLKNLLGKLENYVKLEDGQVYETLWRLDLEMLGGIPEHDLFSSLDSTIDPYVRSLREEPFLDVPCPNHDFPLLQIPKQYRKEFLQELFSDSSSYDLLLSEKEYQWVFSKEACTVCTSLYNALREKHSFEDVFPMLHVRRHFFRRQAGNGISIFNPSDKSVAVSSTNEILQKLLNNIFKDSRKVQYLFSPYTKTNNGVYALMDVKENNEQRFLDLHGIVSDGVHKVKDIEEQVASLFFAVINPEDRESFSHVASFKDRIVTLRCRYVLDYAAELDIYRNKFGDTVGSHFLPGIMDNIARVVVATRMSKEKGPLQSWINDPDEYEDLCDKNFLLLRMELYGRHVPDWVSETDRRRLTNEVRKDILSHMKQEGQSGISGRQSLEFFNNLLSTYHRDDRLITMADAVDFFCTLPDDVFSDDDYNFLSELDRLYDNTILDQIKRSLYDFNAANVARNIKNYLFAISFSQDTRQTCPYTGDVLDINDSFFDTIENRIWPSDLSNKHEIRDYVQRAFLQELTTKVQLEGKDIEETETFSLLYERYVSVLKQDALAPFSDNENFKYAIRDYNTPQFASYSVAIRNDVTFLMNNLQSKYDYTLKGAKQLCAYAIDIGLV